MYSCIDINSYVFDLAEVALDQIKKTHNKSDCNTFKYIQLHIMNRNDLNLEIIL